VRSRLVPLRTLALSAGLILGAATLLLPVPGPVGPVLLILAAVVAMAGNGISFAAASEMVGPRRVGTALGLQNTVLFCAVVIAPPTFGLLVGPLGWEGAFVVAAVCPLVGWGVLGPLRGRLR
jgi:MFS family permease